MDWVFDLLIACALKKEAKALAEEMETEYPVIVTGLGTDRTLRALERTFDRRKPSLLIFTGTAGQLAPDVELGDFVFPSTWRFESGTEFVVRKELQGVLAGNGWEVSGIGVTVRKPVVTEAQRRRLHLATGALICDMESAAAMMIAEAYGIPCLAPKVVSDTAQSGMLAFYRRFGANIKRLAVQVRELIGCLEAHSYKG